MTRYRLVSPLGVYAPGTILDTDLPAGQMFSLEWPAARRLAELGVLEPLEVEEPQRPQDEPGWSADATQSGAPTKDSSPALASASRAATHRGTAPAKEDSKR